MGWTPTLVAVLAVSTILCCNFGQIAANPQPQIGSIVEHKSALLGEKVCLQGPSYWCQNFTTARQCNANKHCIQTVWEHQVPAPDNGEICDTCKKMIKQAREELKSNETQENLKLVLEGSCLILIPRFIKPLRHECIKLVDEAIPQLIEALASQMDPQMVCATAGLCNSARITALLATLKAENEAKSKQLNCVNCQAVAGLVDRNFRAASRDQVLNTMLEMCGGLGSYSDGCSATIIVHFNQLYETLAASLNAEGVCHMAGSCHQKYHNHLKVAEAVEIPKLEGDMPCELCEQLVVHLKDVLIANTTEKEFEQVLIGICTQTGNFKKECVDLVETYYPVIYSFLTTELDGKIICTQIGICPRSFSAIPPLYPLLPVEVGQTLQKDPASGLHRVPLVSTGVSVHTQTDPLPLDSLIIMPGDKNLCQMCEYLLHFLQQEITDPKTEQKIIETGEKACKELPDQYAPTCRSFVDSYTTAVIALLAQDIDPSEVCPKIGVCPGLTLSAVECQPCQATTTQLLNKVGSNTSEAHVVKQVRQLCLSLPFEESRICTQMLGSHSGDLADMALAEFTGEEMCYYMQYCRAESSQAAVGNGNTDTNEITAVPENELKYQDNCVMCEFIMKELEKRIQNNKTEDEIRHVVEHVCTFLPSTVKVKCRRFVDQYTDLIVTLLAQSLDPKQVCQAIGLCSHAVELELVKMSLDKCVVCEALMGAVQGMAGDRTLDRDLNRKLTLACLNLPRSMTKQCQDIVHQLAPQIEAILVELPIGAAVCRRLQLCGRSQAVDLVSSTRCAEGPAYWCQSTTHAALCMKISHCQDNVWHGDKPKKNTYVNKLY